MAPFSSTMTFEAAAPPETSTSAESDVVERLRSGDVEVVGELYDLHHEVVRRFAQRLLGDDAAAEDLVHDVFLSLPQAARGFRGESTLRTFLLGVAIHKARRHLRTASRRRAVVERAEKESQPVAMGQEAGCPERTLERKQLAELLTRALDHLSLDQRVAFVLSEVEGRSSREVAAITAAPEGTVRTRLLHARRKLRAWLGEEVSR